MTIAPDYLDFTPKPTDHFLVEILGVIQGGALSQHLFLALLLKICEALLSHNREPSINKPMRHPVQQRVISKDCSIVTSQRNNREVMGTLSEPSDQLVDRMTVV